MLTRNGESSHPCSVPGVTGKASHRSSRSAMLAAGFHRCPSSGWGKSLLECFIIKGCWILLKAFSASIEMTPEFLVLYSIEVNITLIDVQVLNQVWGDQPWDFFGRNDAKAEAPVLWPPHVKSWLIGKDSDAGRDWGQEEKGTTEDEMAGWHHGLDGHVSEWTPGVGDGQGGLACCDSWGRKESDTTERLNWTELILE